MSSLSAFFEDKQPLAFVIMFAALLVLIIVLFLLYRLIFGRRLKAAASGRARQPRLGIVDAFDLDRQRQLVIVRRDNVEHLIMIGGPNDIVLESAIVRNQLVASMPPAREKDTVVAVGPGAPQVPPLTSPPLMPSAAASTASPLPSAAAMPLVMPSQGGTMGLVRSTPTPASAQTGMSLPPAVVPPPAPVAPAPIERPQPRSAVAPPMNDATAENAASPRTQAPPVPQRSGAFPPQARPAPIAPAAPAQAAPVPPAPKAPIAPPPPRPALTPRPSASPLPPRPPMPQRPQRPLTSPPLRADPQPGTAPAPVRGEAPPLGGVNAGGGVTFDNAPPVGGDVGRPIAHSASSSLDNIQPSRAADRIEAAPRVDPAGPKGFETLESLEEEMAKLLGRTTPRREG